VFYFTSNHGLTSKAGLSLQLYMTLSQFTHRWHQSHQSRAVRCWRQTLSENSLSPEQEENATVHAASVSPHRLFGTIYHDIHATMKLVANNLLSI